MIEVRSHPFPGVTIVDRFSSGGRRRPLQQGDRFRYSQDCEMGEQVFEVVAVTAASALVRSMGKNHVERVMRVKKTRVVNGQKFKVDTGEERLVEFDVPQRPFQISRYAQVEVVEGEVD